MSMQDVDLKDFDDAVKSVVGVLRESYGATQGRTKLFVIRRLFPINFGSSVLLGAIAKLLKSTICDDSGTRKLFGKIVHVDCSLCRNTRTIQRAIAEELNLSHAMNIFDKQDEDDDLRGVDYIIRKEITSIGNLINESLKNERFLMIFHYGEVKEVDLINCGIPIFGKGALLCSEEGRFAVGELEYNEVGYKKTTIFPMIYFYVEFKHGKYIDTVLSHIFHKEAVGVIGATGMDGINPELVLDCFFYSVFLATEVHKNSIGVDYDWATHACNYWICDAIIGGDRAWEIGNTLYGVIPRFKNSIYKTDLASFFNGIKSYKGWYSVTSNERGDYIPNVPHNASSYFLKCQGDDPVYVHNYVFQLASNLHVLQLCKCSFDFSSPPFQCCHNLRFLWLDHCTNTGKEKSRVPFFPNLLVFDLRFTEYVLLAQMLEPMTNLRELNTRGVSWKTMSHAWKNLQKLHKLRVTVSSDVVKVHSCSSIDMMNLELLDLSGNTHMESLPNISSARILKMLVLDGCSGLEHVTLAMERALPMLESFSFDGYGPAENWTHSIQLPQKELRLKSPVASVEIVQVTKISLNGCGRLQDIYLRALPNLEELDLSGTAIKILEVSGKEVPKLKKLFLLGCQHLCNLICYRVPLLKMLHVDTRRKKRAMAYCGGQRSFGSHAFIAFTDGRFTWSLMDPSCRTWDSISKVYLLISCMSHTRANIKKKIKEIGSSEEGLVPTSPLLPYNNIASIEDVACLSLVWYHQHLQTLDFHIEIGERSSNLECMQLVGYVQSLHVHDNSSITIIPPTDGACWESLAWCHVERCPKLHSLFSCQSRDKFGHLRIFSASDLLMAYCIWGRDINIQGSANHFQQLQYIYLYNCPRLVFVLPISFTLPGLETLQIAYCSNLQHVFPLDDKYPPEIASGVTFKNLKHIKLYHLHNLEQICEARLTAPVLQTISLRDCWGLRRLPAVACEGPKPVVDCEKEWWNKLEWGGLDAGHDPSLFETCHSAYYKKTLPRVSVLR